MQIRPEGEVLQIGAVEIRPGDGVALAGGRVLRLSVREFELLVVFGRNPARVLSRAELYEEVWGRPMTSGDRSVDVFVHKLRVKLERELPDWRFIHTHFGAGYRFAPEWSGADRQVAAPRSAGRVRSSAMR